jgi:hypothetical protein
VDGRGVLGPERAARHNVAMKSPPRVELLWWAGCPSTEGARAMLEAALEEAGLDPATVELREVVTDAQAAAEGFIGSPTIRIDGRDLTPPDPDEPTGLNCRVYRLRDGRFSPTPDPQDLRDAVARAIA